MLLAAHLMDEHGMPLPTDKMKTIAAGQADFNGKVVASAAAIQLLAPGNLGAPITITVESEGSPNWGPLEVQVWLLGSTSGIPLTQR